MPHRALVLVALIVSSRAFAQTDSSGTHAPRGTIIGATIGVPGYRREAAPELFVVGLNVLHAEPSRMGVDFSIGTMPRALSYQSVVLGARLDAVVPIQVASDLWLMPAAGGSLIGGGSTDGGGGAFAGVNGGIGAIWWSGHIGLRANMTWHHFINASGSIWLAEIGLVGGR